jgi:hypothetical protein
MGRGRGRGRGSGGGGEGKEGGGMNNRDTLSTYFILHNIKIGDARARYETKKILTCSIFAVQILILPEILCISTKFIYVFLRNFFWIKAVRIFSLSFLLGDILFHCPESEILGLLVVLPVSSLTAHSQP